MQDNLIIMKDLKKLIIITDNVLVNVSNKENVLKNKIMNNLYESLELIYYINLQDVKKRSNNKCKLISKIKMIDFYIFRLFEKKCINSNFYNKFNDRFTSLCKMINGWIKYDYNK